MRLTSSRSLLCGVFVLPGQNLKQVGKVIRP